jgi:PAS domain S-box-containing protein
MKYDFSASLFRPPVQEEAAELFGDQQLQSLRVLVNTLTFIVPAIGLALYARHDTPPLIAVAGLLALVVLVCQILVRTGRTDQVPALLIFSVMLAGIGGTVAQGTVRSGAVLVMLVAVVASGTYLSHRALVLCSGITIVALAGINWLELEGMLPTVTLHNGWPLWLTQSATLICLLIMVFYGRTRLQAAYENQGRALNHWERIADALRESQARFMALFHSNPAAVLVQSEDTGYVLDANAAFVAMFGFSIDDMRGLAPPQLWHSADDQQALQRSMQQQNRIQGQPVRARRRDGSAFDAMVYAEFVTQGSERLVITMVLDVSAETQARRALEKSEERFSKAFNFSPLGMTITRMSDGMFLEVNEANERVLGFSREDFMNKTAVAAGVWLSEADRSAYIEALRQHGRLMGYETRMRRKQGDSVDVKIWSERIELDNEPCNLAFTLNVNEEKRKAELLMSVAKGVSAQTGEAFFQSLVEQLALAIGAHGVVVAELTEMGQLASLALACDGQPMPTTVIELEGEPLQRTLGSSGLWFGHLNAENAPAVCPDPAAPPLQSFAGFALRDDDGTAVGLLGAFWQERVDLTDNMQALMTIFASRCNAELLRLYRDRDLQKLQATLEQRVADRTAELELLNRELDTFAYSVSHDLKSPLRSIDGFMHLLQEQTQTRCTPDDQLLMMRVMGSAQRMHGLINDLLALARVSQTQLQRTQVNLSEIAEEVIQQERHRDPGHHVEVVITPNLMADCDARLTQIVLENLLGNAWKYSRKAAQPRIEFGQAPCAKDGTLAFYVRDNGAGFDMSRSDRLFKPFTRLHQPSEFQGSGIGLATVRRIIERHGGQITGEGVVGEGATFCFLLGRGKRD